MGSHDSALFFSINSIAFYFIAGGKYENSYLREFRLTK